MGIFDKLFGRPGKPKAPARNVANLVAQHAVPAVQALLTTAATSSYFLGDPRLPAGTLWPEKDGHKLDFLACIDLETLARVHAVSWLPKVGSLKFFYATDPAPWGFDPKHRGSWAVLFDPESPTELGPPLTRQNIELRKIRSYPDTQRTDMQSIDFTDEELDAFGDLQEREFSGLPAHQLFGYPMPTQGDSMELECQLVSNGIYCGDEKGYKCDRAKELQNGAADWRLLFQIDTDEKLEFMWGDGGHLYFWIREEDARANRFERTWVILQCT